MNNETPHSSLAILKQNVRTWSYVDARSAGNIYHDMIYEPWEVQRRVALEPKSSRTAYF